MQEDSEKNKNILNKIFRTILVLFVFGLMSYAILPPSRFPENSLFSVKKGDPLGVISYRLKEQGYIRSRFLFEGLLILKQGEKGVVEGEYLFNNPTNLISVVMRLGGSDFGFERVKITIPEGFNRKEIASRCAELLENCNYQEFLRKTEGLEGYLFPDTYLVFPGRNEDDLIEKMTINFENKTKNILSGKTEKEIKDIIILASIIEKESSGDEDRKIISGILHNRLKKNMLLQVDATFYYILGKTSSQLTLSDLRIDSPFNTYRYKGLPPEPIGNPGIKSIQAAINPAQTKYLYYLHDTNRNVYYAETHDGHVRNKKLYLK